MEDKLIELINDLIEEDYDLDSLEELKEYECITKHLLNLIQSKQDYIFEEAIQF